MITRLVIRLLLSALFLFAGTLHLRSPSLFLPAMPPWIPFHLLCIEVSGVLELLGGLALLIPKPQVLIVAGWGLALLLVAVFPANIYMATAHVKIHGFPAQSWMAWARLALQPLLILVVLWACGTWSRKYLL